MLIVAIEIKDYKRVREVAITPAADAHLVLLGGNNRAGKSSTLDALTAAFGGAKSLAADPVRHGAKEASIFVKLADGKGGELTIDRTVDAATGKTTLEVRDAEGAVRKPQEVLDRLMGARFLDPLAFLQLAPKEQRAALMKVIKDADRIDQLDEKRRKAFERRTELGRDLAKAEGALASLPVVDAVPDAIDTAKLAAEKAAIVAELNDAAVARTAHDATVRAQESAISMRDRAQRIVKDLEAQLTEAKTELADAEGHLVRTAADLDAAKSQLDRALRDAAPKAKRATEIDAAIAGADAANRAAFEAAAAVKRREETSATVTKLKTDSEACTTALKTIDERKAAILAAAKLPVEGLAITDDGIELAGVPFGQASGAEKLRVALEIAMRASPGLDDVWVRDAALLDDDSLALVAEQAAAAGKRVWLERVGTRDPGVIEIRDGEVVA